MSSQRQQRWSALIQKWFSSDSALLITWKSLNSADFLWTALKTKIFRAKNQHWKSLIFSRNRADSDLNRAVLIWNNAEHRWFLTNSEWQFSVTFFNFFCEIFKSTSSRGTWINPIGEKKWTTKHLELNLFTARDITSTRKFGFSVTAQATKLIWFKFSKSFSRLVVWSFEIISKIEFLLPLCRILAPSRTLSFPC